jgi:hypothetical protein
MFTSRTSAFSQEESRGGPVMGCYQQSLNLIHRSKFKFKMQKYYAVVAEEYGCLSKKAQ